MLPRKLIFHNTTGYYGFCYYELHKRLARYVQDREAKEKRNIVKVYEFVELKTAKKRESRCVVWSSNVITTS